MSNKERAIFEAGIKLGALYHQWVGTPVSPETALSIERAIEKSVILQPFVEEITVHLDIGTMIPNRFGYSEISGQMFDIEIITRVGFSYCRAHLSMQEGYPLMRVIECHDIEPLSNH